MSSTMVRCEACGLSILYEAGHTGADGITFCPDCCPECPTRSTGDKPAGIAVRNAMDAMTLTAIAGLTSIAAVTAGLVVDDANQALAADVDTLAYELAVERVRTTIERLEKMVEVVSTVARMLEGEAF